ncbi:MAG: hypothetical protein V4603_12130 [Pseudomonadota bacterium]
MKTFIRNSIRKTALLAGVAAGCVLLSAAVPAQQQASQEQALRELNIMRNIFDAAMEENENRQLRIGGPDALYLAGQGMVFTFNLPNGNFYISGPDVRVFAGGDFDFDFDFDYDDDDIEISTNSNSTEAKNLTYMREVQQKMQEAQEQMQNKQEEMRDAQREIRDLQRAQRKEGATVDEAELDRLSKQLETLSKEMQTIGNSFNEQQQSFRKEQAAVAETLHAQQATLIFSTLCNYGSTLKSLANGEHVNLVMQNYGNGESKIYVIDYANLANCTSGEQLLQGAASYISSRR